MKSQNTIELNGKRYDVATGTALDLNSQSKPVAKNIDGFFKPKQTQASARLATKPKAVVVKEVAAATSKPVKLGTNANHVKAHKPQAATTLMRSAVKQPEKSLKQSVHVQVSLKKDAPNLIEVKHAAHAVDEGRLARAASSERSPAISRHAVEGASIVGTTIAPTPAVLSVQPMPVKPEATEEPAVPAPQQSNQKLDMFEHAIANATHYVDVKAHHASYKKHRRNHALSLAASSLALLLVAGFVAYQNSPALQLKVASLRSGVSAQMPQLATSGFTYNGAKAGDDQVTVGLKSKQGTYDVNQQDTNWDNVDLIQNIGTTDATGAPTYSTVKAGNVDVYRFSNTDATWVNNGKLYTVSGTSSLTNSQVTTLVKSL